MVGHILEIITACIVIAVIVTWLFGDLRVYTGLTASHGGSNGSSHGVGSNSSSASITQPVIRTKADLVAAVNKCIAASADGACGIGAWDVSAVTDMSGLFKGMTSFNTDISAWNVSAVTSMFEMFRGTTAFNQPLGAWDVQRVTAMNNMFIKSGFNQDISQWDVSKVTNLNSMFAESAFNQDIGSWNVARVWNFGFMAYGNTMFNQDLSRWNVNNGTEFGKMFTNATAFNQRLCSTQWVAKRRLLNDAFVESNGSVCEAETT